LYSGVRSGAPFPLLLSLSFAIGLFLLFLEVDFSFLCSDAGASVTFPPFRAFLAFGAFLVADFRSFHIVGVDSLAPASSLLPPLTTLTSTVVGSAFLGASSTFCSGYSYSFSFTSSSTFSGTLGGFTTCLLAVHFCTGGAGITNFGFDAATSMIARGLGTIGAGCTFLAASPYLIVKVLIACGCTATPDIPFLSAGFMKRG